MFDLTGKTALVTGATGGIGEAIAVAIHAHGGNVILSGRREEKLRDLQSKLGNRACYVPLDVSDTAQISDFAAQCGAQFANQPDGAGVDILVNNAGITRDNLFMRMKEEEWDDVMNINLKAIFLLTQSFIKTMMKKRYGRIVNIGSVVGSAGNPGQANYCSAKAGLLGFSKSLAQELASRNITVNCVAPGFIRTEMTDKLNDAQKEGILSAIPLGAIGEAEDIAAATVYLASSESKYMTGQTLHVNGGMLMI
ncbi:MAG: 3-oxoacyl-[acyl-carrier-protein] reductase [Alphaproteobacteria bacterium]|nr:3-oxoacyl-[acyl-carrier-protein] reductase [Alphaproteobacteria bacterium]